MFRSVKLEHVTWKKKAKEFKDLQGRYCWRADNNIKPVHLRFVNTTEACMSADIRLCQTIVFIVTFKARK